MEKNPNAGLTAQISDLKEQLSRKHDAWQQLNMEVKDLKSKLKSKSDAADAAAAANAQLKAKVAALEIEVKEAKASGGGAAGSAAAAPAAAAGTKASEAAAAVKATPAAAAAAAAAGKPSLTSMSAMAPPALGERTSWLLDLLTISCDALVDHCRGAVGLCCAMHGLAVLLSAERCCCHAAATHWLTQAGVCAALWCQMHMLAFDSLESLPHSRFARMLAAPCSAPFPSFLRDW